MTVSKFIRADIGTHDNWKLVENEFLKNIKSNRDITFVSFCEMYFYKKRIPIQSPWCGINQDPEDTEKIWKNRSILNNNSYLRI